MKNINKILVIIGLSILLIGCSGGSSSSSQEENAIIDNEPTVIEDNTIDEVVDEGTLTNEVVVTFVNNPFLENYPDDPFARNVWDMQVFDNSLYFGVGNSANDGPSENAGPVPVVKFDKVNFTNEFYVDDEQIDIFKIYNNTLFIPGHDATESWDYGNFYTKQTQKTWNKLRTIPNALHVLDIIDFNNKLYAAVGSDYGAIISTSSNNGASWTNQEFGDSRIYAFLPVADKLYAVKKFLSDDSNYESIALLNTQTNNFDIQHDILLNNMFPDTSFDNEITSLKIFRVTPIEEKTLYIGAYKYNSYHPIPFGLYLASYTNNSLQSKRINLENGYIPRDILIDTDNIYLLISVIQNNETIIKVLKSKIDANIQFEEIISFTYPTFARSFEKLDNDFYFGMGCDLVNPTNPYSSQNYNLPAQTGDILKVTYP